jgi:hypothetical protein
MRKTLCAIILFSLAACATVPPARVIVHHHYRHIYRDRLVPADPIIIAVPEDVPPTPAPVLPPPPAAQPAPTLVPSDLKPAVKRPTAPPVPFVPEFPKK